MKSGNPGDKNGKDKEAMASLPQILLRRSVPSNRISAIPYNLELTEEDTVTGVNIWADNGLVGIQVIFDDADGISRTTLPILRPGLSPTTAPTATIDFKRESFIGISGTKADRQDGGHVSSLSFRTTKRTIPAIAGASGSTFAIDLDSIGVGALLIGFFGEVSGAGLTIGLSALIRGPFPIGEPATLWVDRNTGIGDPAEDLGGELTGISSGNLKKPNPTWATTEVFRVIQDGETLRLVHEEGKDEIFRYVGIKRTLDSAPIRMLYRSDQDQRLIEVEPPIGKGTLQIFLDSVREIKPMPPYPDRSKNKDALTWDGTFNLPERTGFDDYLYCGHDIFKINPVNLQHSTGKGSDDRQNPTAAKRQFVFKYPDGDSFDYHTTTFESGVRVAPNGSFFVPRQLSEEQMVTHEVTTEREYHHTWSQSVGVKLGFNFGGEGPNGSFSENEEFRNAVTSAVSDSFGLTVSTARALTHVHVLDKARIRLDPIFVSRVEELLNAISQDETPGITRFLDAFGTHFANAITFGGQYFMERRFTKTGMMKKLEAGVSVGVDASIGFGPFTAGINANEKDDVSNSVKRNTEDEKVIVRTVGGELSVPNGFHLAGKPVPIMMDLRPLTDLLNPIFFPDTDRNLLAQLRDQIFVTVFEKSNKSDIFSSASRLPATVFEIKISDVVGLQEHLSVLDRLEINVSTTGPATNIARTHPAGPTVAINGPLRNVTGPDGLGTLEDLVVNVGDRFYISPSRLREDGKVLIALPESKLDLRLTVRGKWINPGDHNIEGHLLLTVDSISLVKDGDVNEGSASLRYSQFTKEENFAQFRVPRAKGNIIVRMSYRNQGLPLTQSNSN